LIIILNSRSLNFFFHQAIEIKLRVGTENNNAVKVTCKQKLMLVGQIRSGHLKKISQ